MKQQLFFLILILLIPITGFSQINSLDNLKEFMNSNYIRLVGSMGNEDVYEGSPYDKEEFINGSLATKTNQIFQDVPLRLNLYKNEIEFKNADNNIFILANPELFECLTIDGTKIKYLPYSIQKKIYKGYFKVVEEGEATLLIKPKIVFREATKPAGYQEAKPASFNRVSDEIFIKVGEREAQLVNSKKSMEEILTKKQALITGFLKENKIKLTNADDVLKVVRFYNSN